MEVTVHNRNAPTISAGCSQTGQDKQCTPQRQEQAQPVQIALAVYNGERYLRGFLDSLLSQSFSNFRLVVSDNASTDDTLAILRSYLDRFPHGMEILPSCVQTTSAAQNFARVTDFVTAPYVMYADADDVWHSDKVEKTYAAMRRAERQYGEDVPILVHTDLAVVDHELRPLSPSYWRYQNIDPTRTQPGQILIRNCVTGCTSMLNRALLTRIRPVPAEAPMHDHWCAVTAATLGRIVALDEPLISYRQHSSNDTGAFKWTARFLLRRFLTRLSRKTIRRPLDAKIRQAQTLLARHGSKMDPESRAAVEAVSSLNARNPFSRRICMVKYGLYDTGLARNLNLFLTL